MEDNVAAYKTYFNIFETAIEERLTQNCRQLLNATGLTQTIIEASQYKHFSDEEEDLLWILNLDDYIHEETPDWLTYKQAELIYQEIKLVSLELRDRECKRLNK